jgi:hypothetical protein
VSHHGLFSKSRTLIASASVSLACISNVTTASDWYLTAKAFGPVHVGMTFEQVQEILPHVHVTPPEDSSLGCFVAEQTTNPALVLLFTDGRLKRLELGDRSSRTAANIRIGDSVAVVRRAYRAHLAESVGPDHVHVPHIVSS